MKHGFWDSVYEFIASMEHAGSWQLDVVIVALLLGLCAWVVWVRKTLKREAGI